MESEEQGVDALVNDVARAMTDGTPSEALRANVVRRIGGPVPRTYSWRPLVAAAAAVAVVAVSALWQWSGRTDVPDSPDRVAIDPAPPPSARDAAPAAGLTVSAVVGVQEPAASRSPLRVGRQTPGLASEPGALDIAPLTIDPVGPAEIEVAAAAGPADVDIAPIAIRPLAIGRLDGDQLE
jgi:hypothetical protein